MDTTDIQTFFCRLLEQTRDKAIAGGRLTAGAQAPRADSTVWMLVDLLPAHPIITGPVAAAITGRARPRVYEAINHLVAAGVLLPLGAGKRNRMWEVAGMLEVIEEMEAGRVGRG